MVTYQGWPLKRIKIEFTIFKLAEGNVSLRGGWHKDKTKLNQSKSIKRKKRGIGNVWKLENIGSMVKMIGVSQNLS